MAGYIARILLGLTIPSFFVFLTLFRFCQRKQNKETITDTSSATSEEESKITLPAGIQTPPAKRRLVLSVGSTETASDMLESPGAKYCDSVNLSNHEKMTSKIDQLITCLKDVEKCECTAANRYEVLGKAETLLSLVFAIGTERLVFKEEEKEIIGPLMSVGLKFIAANIICTVNTFSTYWLHATISKKISAIEFLIKDYSDFPCESNTLSTRLEELKIRQLLKFLEDIKDVEWVQTDSSYDSD